MLPEHFLQKSEFLKCGLFKGCFLGVWTVLTFLDLYIHYVCTVLTELSVSRGCVLGVGTVLTVMAVLTVLRWDFLDVWTVLTILTDFIVLSDCVLGVWTVLTVLSVGVLSIRTVLTVLSSCFMGIVDIIVSPPPTKPPFFLAEFCCRVNISLCGK